MRQNQPATLPLDVSQEEWRRLKELTSFEAAARLKGFKAIAGIDESGRGPLAGPVVACACMVAPDFLLPGIDDSKKLPSKKRYELFQQLISSPQVVYSVGLIDHEEIDKINIYQATIQAMLLAIEGLTVRPDYLLVDGLQLPHPKLPVEKIIKGDSRSQSIAAASIIAKETRDRIMREYHLKWPMYGLDQHKGYSTPDHISAIAKFGPSPIHRRSFAPLRYSRSQS